MKYIQNLLRAAVIAILALFAFGPSHVNLVAQEETDLFSCTNVSEIPQIECEALVALYNGTDGPNWRYTTGWLVTNAPCSWYGVRCHEGHVTLLNLSDSNSFGLQGALPAEIGNLNNLSELNLAGNQLSSLPAEIGNLNSLTYLYLFSNELSSLPAEIGNLNNLMYLYLNSNDLSSLPAEISNLNNLVDLDLTSNDLSSLPADFSNLNKLEYLHLASNNLSYLPAHFGNLNKLMYLNLASNNLSNLPADFDNLNNLIELYLHSNQLIDISAELRTFLDRHSPYWAYWADTQIDINICTKASEIPQTECEALVAIYNLNTRQPSDWLVTTTPCSWSRITCINNHITELDLSSNDLSSLPAEIGNLNNLTELDLSDNDLGSLPADFGNLNNLEYLILSSNSLSNLPAEIGNLSNLIMLNLHDNDLSSLPAEIGNLNNLTSLSLGGNGLNSLPAEIGNLSSLASLTLSSNQLSSLPAEIGNLNNLTSLSLGSNELNSLPAEIGNLNNLTSLTLSSNQLSSLPAEIGNLDNLTRLGLEYNRLVIPDNDLHAFLTEHDPDWARTQTIAPTDVRATVLGENSIELTWNAIAFQHMGGYYEMSVAEDGSFTVHGTTARKSDSRYLIEGLTSGTTYDIRIRTYTPNHAGYYTLDSRDDQRNELWSAYTPIISATMPISTNTPAFLEEDQEPLGHKLFLPFVGN